MKKQRKFVKIIKLEQSHLVDNFKVVQDVPEECYTRQSNYNLLTKALETYNGKKFENDEIIKEFIKINLSTDEDIAKKQWFEGIEFEGYKYLAWFATVGGMKKETIDSLGICDTMFIRQDYIEFAELVEDLVSLGKFREQEGKEICINKDILSRLSLATSDLITEINMPDIIVLPSATIDYIEDYKTVKPIKTKAINDKGEEVDKVDYELIDYHFDDEIEVFDGGAIATPKVFDSIQKSLGADYPIEFSIIRGYGMAIKGLITKFDILGYLDSTYKGDTAYLKKVGDTYHLLDRWNGWRPVTANTMLLNDSMVKLAKYFTSMEDYFTRLNNIEDKYKNLLGKLYITKVNKKPSKLSDYRRTNYQLINALALTPQEYKALSEQDYQMLKKIIRPFDKSVSKTSNKEFEINTDYIKLFFKNVVDEDINEEDVDYQEKLHKALEESIVDKVNELISLDEDFVKLKIVKNQLGSLVEKKIRDLASGKVTVRGKYQYIAVCGISYMNYAMYRNQGYNGLNKGQFYSADCKDGDIRTISRNPLSAYSEIHNVEFVRSEYLDKWLSDCKELIYFNQKSDILMKLSGADTDGDGVLVVDNPIIRNAVVTPKDGRYFITLSDGEQKKLPYNAENRFVSTYKASGNLIGKIALKAANINSNCQNVPDLYDVKSKSFINWKDLKTRPELEDKTTEELNTYIKDKLATVEYIRGLDLGRKLKDKMAEEFSNYEKEIYIILYNSMKAIDSTKTLVFPNKADMEVINEKYFKKSYFLKYKEAREDVREDQYIYTYSLLDRFAKNVQKSLLDTLESRNKGSSFRDRVDVIQKKLKNEDYNKETYEDCLVEISILYKNYTKERDEEKNKFSKVKKDWDNVKRLFSDNRAWNWKDDLNLKDGISQAKQERNKAYSEIDAKYIPLADEVINKYGIETVSQCVADMERCTENFIIALFWKCFEYLNTPDKVRIIYQKDPRGDILFLHERYKAIAVEGFDNSNVIDRITKEEAIKKGLEKKVRFRMTDKSIIKEIEEALKLGRMYSLQVSDVRVEVFNDYKSEIDESGVLNIVGFEKRKDGKFSITDKSFGAYVQVS